MFWFNFRNLIFIFNSFYRKINLCTLTPIYLGNVSVATVTMGVNSPQPTLFFVITLCVFLYRVYNQDVLLLDFVVLLIVVVFVVIVLGSHLLGMDWSVVLPLGAIICLPERGASVGGVSSVQLSLLILLHPRCDHSRGESPILKVWVCRKPFGRHYLRFRQ